MPCAAREFAMLTCQEEHEEESAVRAELLVKFHCAGGACGGNPKTGQAGGLP